MVSTAALIVAAGRGTRAAGAVGVPKQYAEIAGAPVLTHTLRVFASHRDIGDVLVVYHPDDHDLYARALAAMGPLQKRVLPPVAGGATRQDSVRLGLEALAGRGPDRVLIHDAARPFVSGDIIARVLAALGSGSDAALAAEPVADTLKRANPQGEIAGTVERADLWRAQTPQGFAFAVIGALHAEAKRAGRSDFTDDAALAEWSGVPVRLVAGSSRNTKITTAEDLAMAERMLAAPVDRETRTGTGFDVHRFDVGDAVWLCGVRIPHSHKLEGHSDADVALHALTDAVLGAIGDGDIGQHFPPSDPQWKGAPSRLFLEDAARRVRERGGRILNVDVTLLCEAPRIGPHREAMRAAVAGMLAVPIHRVGVKATTTEGLGFTGRREGIAAMATASVVLPAEEP